MYNYEQRVADLKQYLAERDLIADLSGYKNARTMLMLECTRCGNVFERDTATLKATKYPCDGCRAERKAEAHRKTVADKFMKRFNDLGLNDNFRVVEIPELIKYPAKFQHLACGNIITTSLQNLSRTTKDMKGIASGCEYCSGRHTYTEEELKAYLETERPTYEFIRSYMNDKHHLHVVVKHTLCGREKDMQANYFMSHGEGCRYCNVSGGEETIMYALDKLGIDYIKEKTFDDLINPESGVKLRYDFYVPSHNLLIEYDGRQHVDQDSFNKSHDKFASYQARDEIKDNYANMHGIKLVRVGYNVFGSKLVDAVSNMVK